MERGGENTRKEKAEIYEKIAILDKITYNVTIIDKPKSCNSG